MYLPLLFLERRVHRIYSPCVYRPNMYLSVLCGGAYRQSDNYFQRIQTGENP